MLMDACWRLAIVSLFKQHAMACKLAAVRLLICEGHGPAMFWPKMARDCSLGAAAAQGRHGPGLQVLLKGLSTRSICLKTNRKQGRKPLLETLTRNAPAVPLHHYGTPCQRAATHSRKPCHCSQMCTRYLAMHEPLHGSPRACWQAQQRLSLSQPAQVKSTCRRSKTASKAHDHAWSSSSDAPGIPCQCRLGTAPLS